MNINRSLVMKIGIGIAAVIALIVVVSFIMQLVQILLPVAIVGVLAYIGYRWYARQQKAKSEVVGEVVTVEAKSTEERKKPKTVTVEKAETSDTEATGFEASPERAARIAELENRLSDQQKQPAEATNDLQAQIEERRRRLGMSDDG